MGCPHKCSARGICFNGKCLCEPGYEGKDCAVIVGSKKTHNCPHNCSKHGTCQLGKCFCDPGFGGSDCSNTAKCTADCYNHGMCKYGKCFCQPDYEGDDCSKAPSCPTGGADDKHCSGHGICYQGTCYCDTKYAGDNCAIDTTIASAVTKGTATNGLSGLSAQDAKVMQNISKVIQGSNSNASAPASNGTVVGKAAGANTAASMLTADTAEKSCGANGFFHFEKAACQCYPGFTGARCNEEVKCPASCSGNGECAYGKCFCHPGFSGVACATATKVAAVETPKVAAVAVNVEPKAAQTEDNHFLHMPMGTIIGICVGCAVVGAALGVAVREVQQRRKKDHDAFSVLYDGQA